MAARVSTLQPHAIPTRCTTVDPSEHPDLPALVDLDELHLQEPGTEGRIGRRPLQVCSQTLGKGDRVTDGNVVQIREDLAVTPDPSASPTHRSSTHWRKPADWRFRGPPVLAGRTMTKSTAGRVGEGSGE
jgi:hypothetical protein